MKYLNYNSIIYLIISIVLFTACKDDDDLNSIDEVSQLSGEFIGTLNGEEWISNSTVLYANCLNISISDWQLKTWGVESSVKLDEFKLGRQDLVDLPAIPECLDETRANFPHTNFFTELSIINFDAVSGGNTTMYLDTITNPNDWGFVDISTLKEKKIVGSFRLPFIIYESDSIPVNHPFGDRIVLEGEFSAKL